MCTVVVRVYDNNSSSRGRQMFHCTLETRCRNFTGTIHCISSLDDVHARHPIKCCNYLLIRHKGSLYWTIASSTMRGRPSGSGRDD